MASEILEILHICRQFRGGCTGGDIDCPWLLIVEIFVQIRIGTLDYLLAWYKHRENCSGLFTYKPWKLLNVLLIDELFEPTMHFQSA